MKRVLGAAGITAVVSVIILMFTDLTFGIVIAAALILATAALCLIRKYDMSKKLLVITLTFVIFGFEFFYYENCVVAPSMALLGETVSVSGRILDIPAEKTNSVAFTLGDCVINGEKSGLKLKIYATDADKDDFRLYDEVQIDRLTVFASAEKDEFYYHTLSSGAYLSGASGQIEPVSRGSGRSLLYKIKVLRKNIKDKLTENLGDYYGNLAASLLIGDKDTLDADFRNELRISGASHMFAVSGMHLTLWSGILFLILRRRAKAKILPNIGASLFVVFYAAMTGFSPSVLRAGIMLIAVFIGKMIRRESDSVNALGLSAILLLLNNVYLAGNVSFLLSFFATLAIVTAYPYFHSRVKREDAFVWRGLKSIKNAAFLSLCVLLFTSPLSAFFFGSVSLLSPVSTVLCTLPVQVNMLSAFLGVTFDFIPIFGNGMYLLCRYSGMALDFIIRNLSKLTFAVIPVNLSYVGMWYFLTGVVLLLVYLRKKNYKPVLSALLASVILLLSAEIAVYGFFSGNTEIYIPSIGNQTSVCLSSNSGADAVLIGSGSGYDSFRKIKTYLQRKGIWKLNGIIIPRASAAENGNTASYSGFGAEFIYSPEENENNYTAEMKNGYVYRNFETADYSAGILKNERIKIVFSFYPGGHFENADEDLKSGDVLICRGYLPAGIDTSRFKYICVLTDKSAKELLLDETIKTTADTGDITIKITRNTIKIKEERRGALLYYINSHTSVANSVGFSSSIPPISLASP